MAGPAVVYEFEWDPKKATANRQKHGVPFEQAATVFLNELILTDKHLADVLE